MGAAGGSTLALWEAGRPRTLIFSCLRDKPVAEMAQILFPLFDQVILAPIHSARAAALDDLLAAAKATGTPAVAAESVAEALRDGAGASAGGVVVVRGRCTWWARRARCCWPGKAKSS